MFKKLHLNKDDKTLFAALVARISLFGGDMLDEVEVFEIIEDFIQNKELDIHNIIDLGCLIHATKFDQNRDIWQ